MVTTPFMPALLVSGAPSTLNRLLAAYYNNPFNRIHHLAFFDWAILISYFGVLIILSCYGLHRYEMIRGYLKHRRHLPDVAPQRFKTLPQVTIQLPLFNERYVVERLLAETMKMDYPHHLLQIQVLDDSTDDTHSFTEGLVAEYRSQGLPIEYIHRKNRQGYRAALCRMD